MLARERVYPGAVVVERSPARYADALVFGTQMLLTVSAELLAAERAGCVALLKHIELLAGVLHLITQALVVLRESLDAGGDFVGVLALLLDHAGLLGESGMPIVH